jgi:hypothetical protein
VEITVILHYAANQDAKDELAGLWYCNRAVRNFQGPRNVHWCEQQINKSA